ncbi:metal-dependent transcriptional regulator [Prevotella sp. oral taxon 299]|uniref:metal-dependent transcriptional regulator n=1 Tax=Prevotella sp. oral taxon 299 TaxID=652716 RepID=UPI0001C40341|nr:metal-dependent transcriptional regulator [Prevotella sp. oral taxon 299]EFC71238.1 hypothetical protein HMPREF0669_00943 [Prevotella sp. oral taxon 299 str. F0039]
MNKYITKLVTLLPFKNYSLNEHAQKRQKELQEDFIKQLYNLGGSISFADAFKQKKLLNVTQDELEKAIGAIVLTKEITANEQLELTEKGEQHALKLIRAHRIYEQYLAEHSGYAPTEWHQRANRMEHVISDEEQSRIASLLGNPLFDPHGDPIPTQSLAMMPNDTCELPLKEHTWWRITHVEDDNNKLFKQIADLGLTKDSMIYITEINSTSFSFRYEGEQMCLPLVALEAMNRVEVTKEEAESMPETRAQRLTTIEANEQATIVGLSPSCRGALRRRLMDLGFVKGSRIAIDMESPMRNPIAYVVRGTAIALRHDQAQYILIQNVRKVANDVQ